MPRLRTVKPGFFKNEELAAVPPMGRLLFVGLWTLADREGRLEDRPMRIKGELFPYDRCQVDALLTTLAEKGFIQRYEVDGSRYIQVLNFKKHQSPHIKEGDSTIPAPTEHGAEPVLEQSYPRRSPSLGSGELSLGSGERRRARATPAATPAPTELEQFGETLSGFTEFTPTAAFWTWVQAHRNGFDMEGMAVDIADWCRRERKPCSAGRVRKWIEREHPSPVAANSRAGHGQDPDRFADFRAFGA